MYEQDQSLNERELFGQPSIEDDSESNNGNNEQSPMPLVGLVVGIVERDQALDNGSGEERQRNYRTLPACG